MPGIVGEREGIWTEEIRIHSYDVDPGRKISIESLLRYFQEAAWNHAEHLGLGYSQFRRRGHLWLLSRMMVVVDSYPGWGQSAVVRTWPCGSKSLLALRDFEVLDGQGRRQAAATSGWLIFDPQSRRPQRPEPILGSIRTFPDFRAAGGDAPKLAALESGSAGAAAEVKYSDLDLNDHVNNAVYARWLLDSYPVAFHRTHRVRSLAINFLAELDGNDSFEITTRAKGLRVCHAIRRRIDGTEACRAEIEWSGTDHDKSL